MKRQCCAVGGACLRQSPGNSVATRRGLKTLASPPEIQRMPATLRQDFSTRVSLTRTVFSCRLVTQRDCFQALEIRRVLINETGRFHPFNNTRLEFKESCQAKSCSTSRTSEATPRICALAHR